MTSGRSARRPSATGDRPPVVTADRADPSTSAPADVALAEEHATVEDVPGQNRLERRSNGSVEVRPGSRGRSHRGDGDRPRPCAMASSTSSIGWCQPAEVDRPAGFDGRWRR